MLRTLNFFKSQKFTSNQSIFEILLFESYNKTNSIPIIQGGQLKKSIENDYYRILLESVKKYIRIFFCGRNLNILKDFTTKYTLFIPIS